MAAGQRRRGRLRTNSQRRVRHAKIYGANSPLPKRGTGLKRKR